MIFNKLKLISTKRKMALYFVIFLFAELLIAYLAIMLTANAIADKKNSIVTQKLEQENKIWQEKNMEKLSEKLKIIRPQIQTIENTFINKNRELEFITILEGLAQKNNVVQKLDLKNMENSEKNYSKILLNINIQGQYNDLLNYIKDLEDYRYYINVSSLQFSLVQNNYSLSISADTYWK